MDNTSDKSDISSNQEQDTLDPWTLDKNLSQLRTTFPFQRYMAPNSVILDRRIKLYIIDIEL